MNAKFSPEILNGPRLFYLESSLRRSSLWSILGCLAMIALVATALSLGFWPHQGNPMRIVQGLVIPALAALWLTQYILPRVRVDERGISRRFLWCWMRPWPWEAVQHGRVHEAGGRHCYRFEGRPWWRGGRMHFFGLELEDAEWIRDRLQRAGMGFPAPPIPEKLNVQLKWPDSRKIQMAPSEIIIRKKNRETRYQWDDVRRVEIWRMTPDWREFIGLEISFDNETLPFRRASSADTKPELAADSKRELDQFQGAPSAVISAVVRERVDRARIHDYALFGEPRNVEERDARRVRKAVLRERRLRETRPVLDFTWAFVAFCLAALPWTDSWGMWIVTVTMSTLIALGATWLYWNDHKRLGQL